MLSVLSSSLRKPVARGKKKETVVCAPECSVVKMTSSMCGSQSYAMRFPVVSLRSGAAVKKAKNRGRKEKPMGATDGG
jgi:hypothetical protein